MIIRQLIDQIVLTVQGQSERVDLEVQWAGGHKTQTHVIRPVAKLEQLSYFPELVKRIIKLREQGLSARRIAQCLDAEGWRPAKRRTTFTGAMVQELWNRERAPRGPSSVQRSANVQKTSGSSRNWPRNWTCTGSGGLNGRIRESC